MKIIRTIVVLFFIFCFLSVVLLHTVNAQTSTEQTIIQLQQKVDELQGQEDTLSKQIKLLDSQTSITQLRIESTKDAIIRLQQEISELENEVTRLENALTERSKIILKRIPETYKHKQMPVVASLFLANDFQDFILQLQYSAGLEKKDADLLIQLKATQDNFSDRKTLRESKRSQQEKLQQQLENDNKQLAVQKQQKQTLLTETQGSEAVYERLLAQAKAQLAGFDTFVSSQGTALLSNQTTCNDWGCYYNQRDVEWGAFSLNHTKYTIGSDGCLVTSMAMVMTHYGHKTKPSDINSNPANFASYYPAYLLYTVSANGITATRIGSIIDASLSHGDPVIVGVHAYGGTHFVVLISGSGGNYKMHDPYIDHGHDISFTDHYSLRSVFEINKVSIR